jgi:hypothetical protein
MKRPHFATLPARGHFRGRAGSFTAILALFWLASMPGPAWGQWNPGTPGIYYNGNVGIGTSSPAAPLHVSNTFAEVRAEAPSSFGYAYLTA